MTTLDLSAETPRKAEPGESGWRIVGQAKLAKFIAGRNANSMREQKHNTILPAIRIEGDQASSASYYIATA